MRVGLALHLSYTDKMNHHVAGDVGHWHDCTAEGTLVLSQAVDGVDKMGPTTWRDGQLVAVHTPGEAVVLCHTVVVGQTRAVFIHNEEHILWRHVLAIDSHAFDLPSADKHLGTIAVARVVAIVVFFAAGDHGRHREGDHQN